MNYEIDVHGMTRAEALKAVQEYIEQYYSKGILLFEIIHGYSHGDSLKKFFSDINNYHSNKISFVEPSWNEGRTFVHLKEGGAKNVKTTRNIR